MTDAVTGANGYVGGVIRAALGGVGLVRAPGPGDVAWSFAAEPGGLADVLRARGVTRIVHAAWDMKASRPAELAACVEGSRRLLEAARLAGVGRFTFISTISAFEGARSAYGRVKLEVERLVLAAGGDVLRPGLVYGDGEGGMFGSLRKTVAKARVIPMIGDGSAPQYLLHEAMLAAAVRAELRGVVTVADPAPVAFRDLLRRIAAQEGRTVTLVPVPWQMFYAGLWGAERVGLRLGFKSDSILSFIFQNPAPDFGPMREAGLQA
jgi:nucleoside-diphosphate-sugar epimerase